MNIFRSNSLICLVSIFFIFFSGCGYNLRDEVSGLNGQIISISFETSDLNLNLIDQLRKHGKVDKIYLNEVREDYDLFLNIIEHKTLRYSAALGYGARTKEARLEYFLKIGLKEIGSNKEVILQIKDSANYSFDESRILAIEEIEKQLKREFLRKAIGRINFSLLSNFYEDI